MDDQTSRTLAADAAMIAILRFLVEREGGDFAYRVTGAYFYTDRYRVADTEGYAREWAELATKEAPLAPDESERERKLRAHLDRLWIVVRDVGLDALRDEARSRLEGGGEG